MRAYTYDKIQARREWAKTLLSGEYEQGIGGLRNPYPIHHTSYKFCCLGVACDISGLGEWDSTYYIDSATRDSSSSIPPYPVREYFGLSVPESWTFASFNDELQMTFQEIAQLVLEAIPFPIPEETC